MDRLFDSGTFETGGRTSKSNSMVHEVNVETANEKDIDILSFDLNRQSVTSIN
jgi:hypothetical protein